MLKTFNLPKIDGPHECARRMDSAQTASDLAIDYAVILGRAFPAHSADQTDNGLLGYARLRYPTNCTAPMRSDLDAKQFPRRATSWKMWPDRASREVSHNLHEPRVHGQVTKLRLSNFRLRTI